MIKHLIAHQNYFNQIHKNIHMKCYSNPEYRSHDVYVVMKNIRDTNKEIEFFKQDLSIENIVLSIRKLKQQVKKLEINRVNYVPRPDNI